MTSTKSFLLSGLLLSLCFFIPSGGLQAQSSKQQTVKGPQTYTDIKTQERRIEEAKEAQKKTKVVKVYKPAHQPTWTWTPEVSPTGPVRVEIFINEQRMFVWRGNEIIAETEVSTGKPGHDTPTGYFKIVQKKADHKSNLYGAIVNSSTGAVVNYDATPSTPVPEGCYYRPASMPHFQRLTFSGVGFHAGYLPGRADSHGCIRLPDVMAENVFSVTSVGTPVVIYPYMGAIMPKTAKNDFTKQSVSKPKAAATTAATTPAATSASAPAATAAATTPPAPAPAAANTATTAVKPKVESFIPPKTP